MNIWKDAWIPSLKGYKLSIMGSNEDLTISSLIKNNEWDLNKIKVLISENELSAMLCIPIKRVSMDDKLIWPMERRVELTVKLACHFL